MFVVPVRVRCSDGLKQIKASIVVFLTKAISFYDEIWTRNLELNSEIIFNVSV